jgi:hypothetical protein
MGRRELAVWLGRSMSTHEVTLRMLRQMLDVIALQQRIIEAQYQAASGMGPEGETGEVLARMEDGLTADLLGQLAQLREQVSPILDMVDQSCLSLEQMI